MSPIEFNKIIITSEDTSRLAQRLGNCSDVRQFDEGRHDEARFLADSFRDLESSFREFLDEKLPKLVSSEGEDFCGQLYEIGEDFRHIIYHILEHQRFYRYLTPDVRWQAPPKRA